MKPEDSPEVLARFEAGLRLVDSIVSQIRREMGDLLEPDEMVSFGQEGLLTAARRFDPDLGIPFRKYAYHRIRGAVLDGVRTHGSLSRRSHQKLKALRSANLMASGFHEDTASIAHNLTPESADDRLADQLATLATAIAVGVSGNEATDQGERVILAEDRPDQTAEREELIDLVRRELQHLSTQEAELVQRHFFDDQDIDEIAADLGVSKSWGSRMMARGISKLSRRLRAVA